jgi:NAD(P)H-hydrate epimerase
VTGLPGWLEPLPDAAAMRATDAWAIGDRGIPGLELMERAARALAAEITRGADPAGPIAVVCGRGNNGGDGFAAARLLREAGRAVRVLHAGELDGVRGDARANLERLPGPPPEAFTVGALDGAAVVVDCLLGTGSTGAPRGVAAQAVRAMAGRRVIACDVPSGVDASTGEVAGDAVRALRTVTFAAGKPGLWVSPGKAHAGEVVVADIGIPDGAPVAVTAGLITPAVLDQHRRRGADGTKFASGHVVVCGGSRGLTGAPTLAATGAMRAGAGYVTVAIPAALEPILEVKLTEAMTVGLPEEGAVELVLDRLGRGGALVLGPGAGRAPEVAAQLRELARRAPVPLVLDADGLNAHAGRLEALAAREHPTVLTPHAGELARLLDREPGGRLADAREAAARAAAIVVLKGDDTIVARPDGTAAISRGAAPALATAGTGDVLSGVVAALLARGTEPYAAACGAVLVHARAGQLAATAHGTEGVVAGDVAAALGHALRGD